MNIALDDIRSKAPKGATHYGEARKIGYFKKSGFKWSMYLGDGEWWSDYKDCHDIYWFFGWYYRHRFISPDVSHKLIPLN